MFHGYQWMVEKEVRSRMSGFKSGERGDCNLFTARFANRNAVVFGVNEIGAAGSIEGFRAIGVVSTGRGNGGNSLP